MIKSLFYFLFFSVKTHNLCRDMSIHRDDFTSTDQYAILFAKERERERELSKLSFLAKKKTKWDSERLRENARDGSKRFWNSTSVPRVRVASEDLRTSLRFRTFNCKWHLYCKYTFVISDVVWCEKRRKCVARMSTTNF